VAGRRVAVQLHGEDGLTLCDALRAAGAEVVEIPVYRWLLPEDLGPARRLVEATCAGGVDAITFTSAPAVRNLVRVAEDEGRAGELTEALNGPVVAACVGPVCAAAAREVGFAEPLAPSVGRLGLLVRALSDHLGARCRQVVLAGVAVTLQGSVALIGEADVPTELSLEEQRLLQALLAAPTRAVPADGAVIAGLRDRLGPAGAALHDAPGGAVLVESPS
jgi:uroporphyrinogen-III synthase